MSDPAPPPAYLEVTTSFYALAFILGLFRPKLAVNGQEYGPISWGATPVPVPPGRYLVEAWVPYLFITRMGHRSVTVDVPPGSVVRVRWRAPWLVFLAGKIEVDPPVPVTLPAPPASAPPPPASAPPPPAAAPPPPPAAAPQPPGSAF